MREDKPRLPDGVSSFQEMVPISLRAIDDGATPDEEAARLFGDRFGFLLALQDAFKQSEGRAPPVQRMFEGSHGLVVRAKPLLESAWMDRARPAALRDLKTLVDGWAREGLPSGDPFAWVDDEILAIDREPDRAVAAVQFARRWAWLHESAAMHQELRQSVPAAHHPWIDDIIRSAVRWRLELETAWGTRSFDELLGEPTIEELLLLIFPHFVFGG